MATWYYVKNQKSKKISGVLKPFAVDVVYQVDIPNSNNAAGRNYRDCVLDEVDPERAGVLSDVPQLQARFATKYSNLQSGAVYEISETLTFSNANLTPAQREAEIQARAQQIEDTLLSEKQVEYEYVSRTGSIA